MTTVDGILQMAIHGNLKESTPYNYSKAPMPYGIFERVVFKTLNQADPFDLFPIYNISNDFKLDVFPRSLSFNAKFNPSKAQKIVDVNSPAVVRRSFETAAKEINAKMVSNLGKHNGVEFLLNKLAEKFAVKAENSTDSQIPSLVQDYLAESQKIIEERGVKDRLIMFDDGDIALDAHVDENGIVIEHTLFDEIQKQTGQELYTTSDNQRVVSEDLANGKIDLIIGTQSLIQEGIKYNNLGLVITDEQHRFGVNQRAEFKNKGISPDVLSMSATPIARTYDLTVYGAMEVSSSKIKKLYNDSDFVFDDKRSTDNKLVFNYKNILHEGEKKVLFTNLVIPTEFTAEDLNLLGNFKLKIHAEAIQSANVGSSEEAFEALD